MPGQARFHSFALQHQKYLLLLPLDQALEAVDQDRRIQRHMEDAPTYLPLVGETGDDRRTMALVGYAHHGRFYLGGITAPAHLVAAPSTLIILVNPGSFCLGRLRNGWVVFIEPLFNWRCQLPVRLAHGPVCSGA